jgi:hypothetical protein
MNRLSVRRWLREYKRLGIVQSLCVRDMADMADEPFGRLYTEANSPDGIRSLAAVNLLILMHGDAGVAAMYDLVKLDGWAHVHARQVLEALADAGDGRLVA